MPGVTRSVYRRPRRPGDPPGLASLLCIFYFASTMGAVAHLLAAEPPNGARPSNLIATWRSGAHTLAEARELGRAAASAVAERRFGAFLLANLAFSAVAASAALTKDVFLGELSVIETAKLADRLLRFALLKVVFLGAVVHPRPDDVAAYLIWALCTGHLKAFVGLANDRSQALLSSPAATRPAHALCAALLASTLAQNLAWVTLCLCLSGRGPWTALWLFDSACVAVEGGVAALRYAVQGLGGWAWGNGVVWARGQSNTSHDTAAEAQSHFLYGLDLCADLAMHGLNLAHYMHILKLRGGLRMQLIDVALLTDVRYLVSAAWGRAAGHLRYRRLSRRLRQGFADAPPGKLEGGAAVCAICMDGMKAGKVLGCGHVFHLNCLTEWLQHQGQAGGGGEPCRFTCPLCRANLAVDDPTAVEAPRAGTPWAQIGAAAGTAPRAGTPWARVGAAAAAAAPRRSPQRSRPRPREWALDLLTCDIDDDSSDEEIYGADVDEVEENEGTGTGTGIAFGANSGSSSYGEEVDWDGASLRWRRCRGASGRSSEEGSAAEGPPSTMGLLRWRSGGRRGSGAAHRPVTRSMAASQ